MGSYSHVSYQDLCLKACLAAGRILFLRNVLDPISRSSMIRLGFNRALRLGDLWRLDEDNTSDHVVREFQPNYELERARTTNTKPRSTFNILYPLVRTFRGEFLPLTICRLVETACTFVFPLILDRLIDFIKSDGEQM